MKLRFSRRTDYAIRAALELAVAGRQLTAEQVASRTGAPAGVVAQALAQLARAGVVTAVVGRTGGYRLTRAAAEITMLEVVSAVEDVGHLPAQCVLHDRVCSGRSACPVHPTVAAAQAAFRDGLAADTLAAVAARATASAPAA
jgi:Rrf2 family transcriptional regulator, nitric oxide-sensitive transcriptional repressor